MGKNKGRYDKLELDKVKNNSSNSVTKFKRKLEIFGLPRQEKKRTELSLEDRSAIEAEHTDQITRRFTGQTTRQTTRKTRAHSSKQSSIQPLAQPLGDSVKNPTSTVSDSQKAKQRKKHQQLLERNNRILRQRRKAKIKIEQAQERVNAARRRLIWGGVCLAVLIIVILLANNFSGKGAISVAIVLFLTVLGCIRIFRRWRN